MTKKSATVVIGRIAVLILFSKIPSASLQDASVEDHGCKIFIEDDVLKANCRRMKINKVPETLDNNIKHLDLSNNSLRDVNGSQFKRYKQLELLKMHVVEATFSSSADMFYMFRSLTRLKHLMLNYNEDMWKLKNGRKVDPVFRFPANLKILSMMLNGVANLDLSNLKKLEQLDLYQNDVKIFPYFHPLAPIKTINLTRTNLRRIRAEDLAPLCSLEFLAISPLYVTGLELFTPEKYCECERLKAWMKKFDIKTQGNDMKCQPRSETCDLGFSQELLSVRENCLARKKKSYGWIIFIVVLLIGIVAAGSAAGGYYYYWRQEVEVKE